MCDIHVLRWGLGMRKSTSGSRYGKRVSVCVFCVVSWRCTQYNIRQYTHACTATHVHSHMYSHTCTHPHAHTHQGRLQTLPLQESSREQVILNIKQFLAPQNFFKVLIVSYETFRLHSLQFAAPHSCDLLICDEVRGGCFTWLLGMV